MFRIVRRNCLLMVVILGFVPAAKAMDDHAAAIAAITKLGGKVWYDDDRREKVRIVSLRHCNVTDGDLIHLAKLTDLGSLDLSSTRITDAGLEHLKGLTKLESLAFHNTDVGDVGLELLTDMPKLSFLMLKCTYVTDAGVEKLKRALPACETISYSPRERQRPAASLPVGKWSLTFANGVRQTCEIGPDGAASVVEPLRTSKGKAVVSGDSIVVTFEDERVERWTPVAERLVVEHWHPAIRIPVSTPVLGIAERAK
ncbi:MAG: hypothetical protein NT069_26420 [Planctomycetota bacterium]|nr:hypothetical protein [Planctomycetota bacterium]